MMKKTITTIVAVMMASVLFAQFGLAVGQKAPGFTAKDQQGKTINLYKTLKKGQVVLIFYRGNWCPNCSRALKSYQDSLVALSARNVTVIAISPETAEGVAKTIDKTQASFTIISDKGLAITKQYKVAFAVTKEMEDIHKKYGIDVAGNNGVNGNMLPHPAAFIIAKDGTIRYRYVNSSPYSNPNSNDRITVKEILDHIN
jgi:peroxiredoxin